MLSLQDRMMHMILPVNLQTYISHNPPHMHLGFCVVFIIKFTPTILKFNNKK